MRLASTPEGMSKDPQHSADPGATAGMRKSEVQLT